MHTVVVGTYGGGFPYTVVVVSWWLYTYNSRWWFAYAVVVGGCIHTHIQ